MHELHRIADGRGIGQRIEELVKRRVLAEGEQQGNQRDGRPKPDQPPLHVRERSLLAAGLRERPRGQQAHQHPAVFARAGMAVHLGIRERGFGFRVALVGSGLDCGKVRVLPHRSPVGITFRHVHAIAEQAGDQHAQRLDLRQAPHRRLRKTPVFRFLVLRHADDALDLRADERAQRVSGDEARAHRHQRDPTDAPRQQLSSRPLPRRPRQINSESSDHET